jgi:hypothetical protein
MDDLDLDIRRSIDDSVDETELLPFRCDTPQIKRGS